MAERALVIVPTFNERENIRRLVSSVLAQDERLEVLVVDDGSPDGTGAIVDEMAAADPRVNVLHRARKLCTSRRGGSTSRFSPSAIACPGPTVVSPAMRRYDEPFPQSESTRTPN